MRPFARSLVVALALAAGTTTPAAAQTLSFDDLSTPPLGAAPLPAGYAGFTWTAAGADFGVIDPAKRFPSTPNGYQTNLVSGPNALYSIFGFDVARATAFDLTSGYFGAAWRDGATVEVLGFRDGVQQYATSFVVNATSSTFRTFGWTNVDRLRFSVNGGTAAYGGGASYMVVDDLALGAAPSSVVPEPATVVLLGAGVGVLSLAGLARRRATRG